MSRRTTLVLLFVGALVLALVPIAGANHEGPGEPGGEDKYHLFGTAQDDVDPQNSRNEVISFDTSPAAVVFARRTFSHRRKVASLDNQIEMKYLLVGRRCGGGDPRIQLTIDANGDGRFQQAPAGPDFVMHGHVGTPPGTPLTCLMGEWRYEDLTDILPRWEITPGSACASLPGVTCPFPFNPWPTISRDGGVPESPGAQR